MSRIADSYKSRSGRENWWRQWWAARRHCGAV